MKKYYAVRNMLDSLI